MAGGGQGAAAAQAGQNLGQPLQQQNPTGAMNTQSAYNNFASPNQDFMSYQGQGQPNQPQQQLASTQYNGGPDSGNDYAPVNMGFDGSGSDGGVGGQPAPMMTPLSSGPRGFAFGGTAQPMGGFGAQPAFSPTQGGTMSAMPVNKPMGGSMGVMGGPQFNQPQTPFSPTQGGSMGVMGGEQFNKPMGGQSNQLTQMPMGGALGPMPIQQGNKPVGFSQFQQPKGLQIQGNPTSQVVQRPRQR